MALENLLRRANCSPPFHVPWSREAARQRIGAGALSSVLDVHDLQMTVIMAKDDSYGSYFNHCKPEVKNYETYRAYFDLTRKFARLERLVFSEKPATTSEGLQDALLDIANSATLALAALEMFHGQG